MPKEPEDFRSILERAQSVTPADVSNPFVGREAFVPGKAKGVPDLDYDARIRVFVMPTDAADYEDAMNMCLRGEAVQRYEDRTFTKEGDFIVAFCYLVPRPRPAQAVNFAAGDAEPEVKPQKLS